RRSYSDRTPQRSEGCPHLALCSIFAELPIRKISQIKEDEDLAIIVLLPGISNPMWRADWTFYNSCSPFEWLRAFRNRILKHYNLLDDPRDSKSKMRSSIDR